MTREEAINLYWNVRYNLANEKQKAALDMAFSALREQPRWISVDERLPEDWVWVQVYRSANQTMDTDFCTPSKKGGWCHYNDITHWMPLPDPPEVEV